MEGPWLIKRMACRRSISSGSPVSPYRRNPRLIDYSASKGAIVSFARSLSPALASRKICANAVAPGPIWMPLIPATFSTEHVKNFGKHVARTGQPEEVAPCYLFLASDDSSCISGQVLHPNGGEVMNT